MNVPAAAIGRFSSANKPDITASAFVTLFTISVEIFESSPNHISTKYLLKVPSVVGIPHQSRPLFMDISWVEMK